MFYKNWMWCIYNIYIYICACVSVCMYLRKFVNKCICVYVKNDHRCTWVNDCESFIEEKIGCLNFSCVHQINHHKNPDNFFIELYWKWDYALENEQYRHFLPTLYLLWKLSCWIRNNNKLICCHKRLGCEKNSLLRSCVSRTSLVYS